MLEPDNTVHQAITHRPEHDAGGLRDANPRYSKQLVHFVEAQARKIPGKENYHWYYYGTGLVCRLCFFLLLLLLLRLLLLPSVNSVLRVASVVHQSV